MAFNLETAMQEIGGLNKILASKDLEIHRLRQALFGLCGEAEKLLEAEMVHYHDSRTVPALIVGLARSVMDARAALSNPPAQQQDVVVVPRSLAEWAIRTFDELDHFMKRADNPCGYYDRECPISHNKWFDTDDRKHAEQLRELLKEK